MKRDHAMPAMSWGRLAGMIATSTLIMFLLMYQLVFEMDHVTFSVNRAMASLVMGAIMTAVMLAFMWPMYRPNGLKVAVLTLGVLAAAFLMYVNRSQALVGDVGFMRSMIPHHSIAINNARKSAISDPRVRELADGIIQSQVREIEEMRLLLDDIDVHGERGKDPLPAVPAEVTPQVRREALESVR